MWHSSMVCGARLREEASVERAWRRGGGPAGASRGSRLCPHPTLRPALGHPRWPPERRPRRSRRIREGCWLGPCKAGRPGKWAAPRPSLPLIDCCLLLQAGTNLALQGHLCIALSNTPTETVASRGRLGVQQAAGSARRPARHPDWPARSACAGLAATAGPPEGAMRRTAFMWKHITCQNTAAHAWPSGTSSQRVGQPSTAVHQPQQRAWLTDVPTSHPAGESCI